MRDLWIPLVPGQQQEIFLTTNCDSCAPTAHVALRGGGVTCIQLDRLANRPDDTTIKSAKEEMVELKQLLQKTKLSEEEDTKLSRTLVPFERTKLKYVTLQNISD